MNKYIILSALFFSIQALSFGGPNPGENLPTLLHWNICEDSIEKIISKSKLQVMQKKEKDAFFFDTQSKDLYSKQFLLFKTLENKKWNSYLLMNYESTREIPDFIAPSMKCFKNIFKDSKYLSCLAVNKNVNEVKITSETQEHHLQEFLKKDFSLIKLNKSNLEKVHSAKLKYKAKNNKEYTLNLEHLKKTDLIHLSVKVNRLKEEIYFDEISDFLKTTDIKLCDNQNLKLPEI